MYWRMRPRSLFRRLALFAVLLYASACAFIWIALQMAIREPAQAVVDNRLLALAAELPGYWATAEITGAPPYGPGDVELIWQIADDTGVLYRSDLLFFDDLVLPAPDAIDDTFTMHDMATPLGLLRTVVRRREEAVPAAPGSTAQETRTVTYWAAIGEDRRRQIMAQHAAPFERAAIHIMIVLALVLFAVLAALGLSLRATLARLGQAARRFRAGETTRLEGRWPREIAVVVAALNAALSRADQHVARTRRYIGKIGHDLKHPLAVVENALDRPEEHAMARRRLAAMAALLDRYTTLASAVGPGAPAPAVALRPLLEEARDGIALLYRRTPLTIDIDCPADLRVRVPRQDVEAMLGNLLTNAARHAARRIEVRALLREGLILEVADDGPGLDEKQRRLALGWGERLDTAPPGSGFGLAIVKDLVELHGGRIDLDVSKLGGLRVLLTFPNDEANPA